MLFLFFCFNLSSCNASSSAHLEDYKTRTLILDSGEEITVFIAESEDQQRKGLSSIKDRDFKYNMGMLFPESKMRERQFWMPETYFDLDIFFMNEDFYILDIHRGLKHNPKSRDKVEPTYSKVVFCQHVLELKSSSPLAKKLRPGMILKWKKKAPTP